MSACDTCPVPGHCCRFMYLTGVTSSRNFPEAFDFVAAEAELEDMSLPMRPLLMNKDGAWALWCPNLNQVTGRCMDYDNRPDLCRNFEPGENPLCILHVPTYEAPEPTEAESGET